MSGRFFTVGDIHGCAAELEVLLRGLRAGAGDTIAFVGDYIDRGTASRAVIDQLIALRQRTDIRTIFLKGNHEDMCLSYFGRAGHWGEAWHLNGGVATLRSWSIDPQTPGTEAVEALPDGHLEFLESLVPMFMTDRWLLVHAGIRPDIPLAKQDEEDLFWIREDFIAQPHPLPQTIIYGHTPTRRVHVNLPYKIGIDTGCVYGGLLTCLELESGTLYQVAYGEKTVRESRLVAASGRAVAGARGPV
jgi:diadenosine tetraphosphatase ApaH/serine/threonine PP2A family protein phosphatase